MNKPTPAQQHILNMMQQGYVLSSTLDTKYLPFNMKPEHSGTLRHPSLFDIRRDKTIIISTIKAMLAKGFIAEQSRYICSSGTWGGHETETWCIRYNHNMCIHCYEQPASPQFNSTFCADCANEMGEQWEAEWNEQVKEMVQS